MKRLNAEKADFGRMLVLLDSSAGLLKNGNILGAIAQRREAITISPGFAEAHYELGLASTAADASSAEAEAAFRRAIALDPNHARAYAALARLLDARGNEIAARAARTRATALTPAREVRGRANPLSRVSGWNPHSSRSTSSGSNLAAERLGTYVASSATEHRSAATPA